MLKQSEEDRMGHDVSPAPVTKLAASLFESPVNMGGGGFVHINDRFSQVFV